MNYSRFYALLKQLPKSHLSEQETKEVLVSSASNGRTTSLRELTFDEYLSLLTSLTDRVTDKKELKKWRSIVLCQMQKLGVDTTDWSIVDNFCCNPRIASCRFARLSLYDLKELSSRLHAIESKRRKEAIIAANTPSVQILSFNHISEDEMPS